jgi:hypothetical protein
MEGIMFNGSEWLRLWRMDSHLSRLRSSSDAKFSAAYYDH